MNNIITQDDGLVMVFTALILPVILIIGALMIDGGKLYQRHAEIEHLSRQSGQLGLLTFSSLLNQRAEQNYQSVCSVLLPPSRCGSDNLFDFVDVSDVQILVFDAHNQDLVVNKVKQFGTGFDPRDQLEDEEITITYPYQYNAGDLQLKLLVEIETTPELFLRHLWGPVNPIRYQSVSFLPLS